MRKISFIILLVIIIVDLKNIIRINNEFNRDDFYSFKISFFAIRNKEYENKNFETGLIYIFLSSLLGYTFPVELLMKNKCF